LCDRWDDLLDEVVESFDVEHVVDEGLATSKLQESGTVEELVLVLDSVPALDFLLNIEVGVDVLSEKHFQLLVVHQVYSDGLF
jgi:hypothetical protein